MQGITGAGDAAADHLTSPALSQSANSRVPTVQDESEGGPVKSSVYDNGATPQPFPTAGRAARIRGRQVTKTYVKGQQTVEALGPLDFDVADREFLCIVGPSGCGKSTLLRILGGLVSPSGGKIEVATDGSGGRTAAMVFQDYSIYPWKTVERNVTLGLDIAGVPKAEAKERANHWLGRLGLEGFANAYPTALSGGMRQRVAIARALAVEPEILLMDEPFAALDAQLRMILQEELLALWEADSKTVILVTHSLDEALILGDRILVMSARPGRVVADYSVDLPRPRTTAVRTSEQFQQLHKGLWNVLRQEVERTLPRSARRSSADPLHQ